MKIIVKNIFNNYKLFSMIKKKRICLISALLLFSLLCNAQKNTDMLNDTTRLDEVVVVGYGTQTRNQLTKSVSSISSTDIERLAPVSMSVQDILASGLAGGVLAMQHSGEPGAAVSINVRGITSAYLNMTSETMNNSPLFVIDGIPTYLEATPFNPLLNISPNDIESIDVLKDAAATAIYGSRGANGVVMIKTKASKKNTKPRMSFGYTVSTSNPVKRIKPLNNAEYREYQTKLIKNGLDLYNQGLIRSPELFTYYADIEPTGEKNQLGKRTFRFIGLRDDVYGSENIDWEEEVLNSNAMTHNYNFSIDGGTEKTTYTFSLHGANQEGLYKNDRMNTFGGRLGITTDINKYIRIGITGNYSETRRKYAITEESFWDTPLFSYPPDKPIFDEDGNYNMVDEIANYGESGAFIPTPAALLTRRNKYDGSTFFTNGFAEIRILDGLKFRTNFGYNKTKYETYYFTPTTAKQDMRMWGEPLIAEGRQKFGSYRTTTVNFQLDYKIDYKNHAFQALAGYETERSKRSLLETSMEDYPNDQELSNPGSAKVVLSQDEILVNSGLNSWFSRISYGYDNKYFADLSFRADGSSRFGPNNRWALFPAASLGWAVNRESFLKEVKWLDKLKIRASVGQTGSTNIDDFAYEQFYNSRGQYNGGASIVLNDMLPNHDVKWEKTTDYNLGLDFSLFNHRLYGNVDVYWRKTDGALAPAPHLLESGLSIYYDNIIDLTNRGVELSLGGEPVRTKDFSWNTILNVSRNKSKIDKLNNAEINPFFQDAYMEGQPVGIVKGYVFDHFAQTQQEVDNLNAVALEKYGEKYQRDISIGDGIYKDINGNGIIDEGDRTIIANPEPDFFGSWYNQLSYKNFALSFIMSFSVGADAYYTQLQRDAYMMLGHSISREVYYNSWSEDNPNARFNKIAGLTHTMADEVNDRFVYDASYLRMKNVTLSYQIPSNISKKLYISNASLFLTATNLFTITNWPGRDPETISEGAPLRGQNDDPYPLGRSFSFGVKFNL